MTQQAARRWPSGDRLLRARQLLDGRTGELVATIDVELHPYLEGGPAQPWMSLGTAHLICGHGEIQVWDTRTGAPLAVKERLRFPHWYSLAYDRAAARVAVLRRDTSSVTFTRCPTVSASARCPSTLSPPPWR